MPDALIRLLTSLLSGMNGLSSAFRARADAFSRTHGGAEFTSAFNQFRTNVGRDPITAISALSSHSIGGGLGSVIGGMVAGPMGAVFGQKFGHMLERVISSALRSVFGHRNTYKDYSTQAMFSGLGGGGSLYGKDGSTSRLLGIGASLSRYGGSVNDISAFASSSNLTLEGMRKGGGGGALMQGALKYGLDITGSGAGGLATTEELLRNIARRMEGLDANEKIGLASTLGMEKSLFRLVENGEKEYVRRSNEFSYITGGLNTEYGRKKKENLNAEEKKLEIIGESYENTSQVVRGTTDEDALRYESNYNTAGLMAKKGVATTLIPWVGNSGFGRRAVDWVSDFTGGLVGGLARLDVSPMFGGQGLFNEQAKSGEMERLDRDLDRVVTEASRGKSGPIGLFSDLFGVIKNDWTAAHGRGDSPAHDLIRNVFDSAGDVGATPLPSFGSGPFSDIMDAQDWLLGNGPWASAGRNGAATAEAARSVDSATGGAATAAVAKTSKVEIKLDKLEVHTSATTLEGVTEDAVNDGILAALSKNQDFMNAFGTPDKGMIG